MYKQNGMRGMYQGFGVSLCGIIVHRAVFFGVYDTAKSMVYRNPKAKSNPVLNFLLGFGVETVAGVTAYPLDTVRRRLMIQSGRKEKLYNGAFDCFRKIIRDEGVGSFYKGCMSNIIRGVGGACVLVMYDEMKKVVDKDNKPNK
eukprot:CAMPEP_0113854574 /NCGR_PEP_ID=MMETSP0372-20130328/7458_1 /TAXON_ID=340204 /ORGANISM="Lankesteria abbotti" /LENGTH=143 /DNA_ID=CAMNT_0000827883 /DNA_START=344 /DNA_END=775 /DNA_ORIENTATION=- /assembly_acc=CAM_ASM_000359